MKGDSMSFWEIVLLFVVFLVVNMICNIIMQILNGILMRKQREQMVDKTLTAISRKLLDLRSKMRGDKNV